MFREHGSGRAHRQANARARVIRTCLLGLAAAFAAPPHAPAQELCRVASIGPIMCRANALTVMTLNVQVYPLDPAWKGEDNAPPHRWPERLPRIVQMLMRHEGGRGPHVIGMQEVRLGRHPQQYHDLVAALPDYASVYSERGEGMQRHEGVALFWRRDRIELIDHGEMIMDQRDRREAGGCSAVGDRAYPIRRPVVWALLRDVLWDQRLYVYNTHLGTGRSECQFTGSVVLLANGIARRPDHTIPLIVMGDFNVGKNAKRIGTEENTFHLEYQRLTALTGLENTYLEIQDIHRPHETGYGSGNSQYTNERTGNLIDHILISGPLRVQDADVDRTMFTRDEQPVECRTIRDGRCVGTAHRATDLRMYSDHWGVWARLGLVTGR